MLWEYIDVTDCFSGVFFEDVLDGWLLDSKSSLDLNLIILPAHRGFFIINSKLYISKGIQHTCWSLNAFKERIELDQHKMIKILF